MTFCPCSGDENDNWEKETLTLWLGIEPLVIIVLSNVDVIMFELNLLTKCLNYNQMSTERLQILNCGRPWPAAYINFNQNIHQIQF